MLFLILFNGIYYIILGNKRRLKFQIPLVNWCSKSRHADRKHFQGLLKRLPMVILETVLFIGSTCAHKPQSSCINALYKALNKYTHSDYMPQCPTHSKTVTWRWNKFGAMDIISFCSSVPSNRIVRSFEELLTICYWIWPSPLIE